MPLLHEEAALIRLTEANYGDGVGSPVSSSDPLTVSRDLFDQDGVLPNSAGLSNLFVAWGQFLDHDITLSEESCCSFIQTAGLAPLHRSTFTLDDNGTRIQMNEVTWQIDGSQIYGSTDDRAADLRAFEGGFLKVGYDATSTLGLMPAAGPDTFMAGDITSDDPVFLAGDVRANENPALASVHTVMVRNHNYWADRLAEKNPEWSDQQLYDGARQIVEYQLQKITYDEWLPHLVGDAVGEDTGHDPEADGQISVEFSTAAFRFGHTMVSSEMPVLDETGQSLTELEIMDAFFNDDVIKEHGIDAILRGQMCSYAQELDTKVVDDLNFFLETPDGTGGFSLVALNIMRAADHGLQNYIDTRAALMGDIDPAEIGDDDFWVITSDADLQAQLADTHESVHDVSLWVGGLAEDKIEGTQTGKLFAHIIADQFARIRAADDTYGDLDLITDAEILAEVKSSTFADVIRVSTNIDHLAEDVFLATEAGLTEIAAVRGGDGDDSFDIIAKSLSDRVMTGKGDDAIAIRGGSQLKCPFSMGEGADSLAMSSGRISGLVNMDGRAGAGRDTVELSGTAVVDGDIFTRKKADDVTVTDMARVEGTINTGRGKDDVSVTGKAQVGEIKTKQGSDDIHVGSQAQVGRIDAGRNDDQITLQHGAAVGHIDGGSGSDTLKVEGGNCRVDHDANDPNAGTLTYLDDKGAAQGTVSFSDIEFVACFTPGMRMITSTGRAAVEDLAPGDRVLTLDRGLQEVRWIGQVTVPAEGHLAPIRFAKGALGNSRAMEVSPQHRMLLEGWRAEMYCGVPEVLVPAKFLVNDTTITRRVGGQVRYIHLLFDQHELVIADDIPSESFHPGCASLSAMEDAARAEVLTLFPQLAVDPSAYGPAARYSVKAYEAALIAQTVKPS